MISNVYLIYYVFLCCSKSASGDYGINLLIVSLFFYVSRHSSLSYSGIISIGFSVLIDSFNSVFETKFETKFDYTDPFASPF